MIIDIISQLAVHPSKTYSNRDLKGVDTIIVHQTGGNDKGLASPYADAKFHVDGNNWPGIGYHVYVTDDEIYKTNELETRSYHASNYNKRSIGIAITGKHKYDPNKTNEQIIGQKKYNLLISAIVKTLRKLPNKNIKIKSHDDVDDAGKTDPNLDMDQLRRDVKKKRDCGGR